MKKNSTNKKAFHKDNSNNNKSSARAALTLMLGTLASRITGLLRTSLLLQFFPSNLTDSFFVAWKIPNLFRELLAEGALINSFVPTYASLPKEEAKRLISALLVFLGLINNLLLVLALWLAPYLVNLLLARNTDIDYDLTVALTRLIFPFLSGISFSALAMGILNAEERFFAPAWAPVALNITVIFAIILFPERIDILTLSLVLGSFIQFFVQLPSLINYQLWPRIQSFWHPQIISVLLLMLPFAFTTSARQILNIVSTKLLSGMPIGSVTAYENANLVLSLVMGLFAVSPALAFYSRLSTNAIKAPHEFRETLLSGLRFISFLCVPIGLLLFALAEPSVMLIWNWRPAEGQLQSITYSIVALAPLGIAVFPLGLNNLLMRPFYIRKQVHTPIIVTVIFSLLNGMLYYLLAPRYGIASLSWSTALVAWLQMTVLINLMHRNENLDVKTLLKYNAKVWTSGLLAAAVAYLTVQFLPTFSSQQLDYFLQLCIAGGSGLIVYIVVGAVLKIPELLSLLEHLKKLKRV